MLTGRQPPRVGMVGVINSLSAVGLPLHELTLGNHMQTLGYKTLAIGVSGLTFKHRTAGASHVSDAGRSGRYDDLYLFFDRAAMMPSPLNVPR